MKIAILGTRGIPNNYGGFETLAENIVDHIDQQNEITVYCSSKDLPGKQLVYNGAKLKYIPITSHGALGILYDCLSLIHALFFNKSEVILFLGFGAGFIMPFLSTRQKKRIIVNFGGLDWRRNKWSVIAQKVIRFSEKLLVRNSALLVSDNIGISNYIDSTYRRDSFLIPYGGDQAFHAEILPEDFKVYPFLNNKYAFIVTRIQEDNNIEMMLDAFLESSIMPFVIVGNWCSSEYGLKIKKKYEGQSNLFLFDAIYERNHLEKLRSNCYLYIHGHSAGGTNPSLCEAMFLGLPIMAFSSGYNEYTTENKAIYFSSKEDLKSKLSILTSFELDSIGKEMKRIADKSYRWNIVVDKYLKVFEMVVDINKKSNFYA